MSRLVLAICLLACGCGDNSTMPVVSPPTDIGRRSIALPLPTLPEASGEVLQRVEQLKSKDRQARFDAAERLGEMGASARAAIPALVEVAIVDEKGSYSFFPGLAAQEALQKIGIVDAIPFLIDALLHEQEAGKRYWAARFMGECGEVAAPAALALREELYRQPMAVTEADESASGQAAAALAKIGPRGVDMLLDGITHKNEKVRLSCAWAISNYVTRALGTDPKPYRKMVVPTLTRALSDTNSSVRFHAAAALGDVTEEADESLVHLEFAVRSERDSLARSAMRDAIKLLKAQK